MTISDDLSQTDIALAVNHGVWNTTKALLIRIAEVFPKLPYMVGNDRQDQIPHIHMIKSVDWNIFPFYDDQQRPMIPAIVIGLPRMVETSQGYASWSSEDYEATDQSTAVTVLPSVRVDLHYDFELLADNAITLQYMMGHWTRLIRTKLAEISVRDHENNRVRVYDVDSISYPDGSQAHSNVDNIYPARGEFVVRSVELTSGEYQTWQTVREYKVVAVRINQTVQATVNNSELIITVQG